MRSACQPRVHFNAAECDPVSDPEPPVPPLPEPDPGVFHRDPDVCDQEPGEPAAQPESSTRPAKKDHA